MHPHAHTHRPIRYLAYVCYKQRVHEHHPIHVMAGKKGSMKGHMKRVKKPAGGMGGMSAQDMKQLRVVGMLGGPLSKRLPQDGPLEPRQKKWMCLYPAYVNSQLTKKQGRLVGGGMHHPTIDVLDTACRLLGLRTRMEREKRYARDAINDCGRLRVDAKFQTIYVPQPSEGHALTEGHFSRNAALLEQRRLDETMDIEADDVSEGQGDADAMIQDEVYGPLQKRLIRNSTCRAAASWGAPRRHVHAHDHLSHSFQRVLFVPSYV